MRAGLTLDLRVGKALELAALVFQSCTPGVSTLLVLTVAKGPDRGKVFELRGLSRVVIGRNSPDLRLNDIMISRYHARLKLEGGKWYVRDLGSRNGTKLNGEKLLKPVVLKTGDHIITGYTEFAVSFAPDPVDAPAVMAAAPSPIELADEPLGAASSAEIGGASEDALPGAESDDDLSLHRDDNEEPPAAVALTTSREALNEVAAAEAAINEKPADEIEPREIIESIEEPSPAVAELLEHVPVAAVQTEPVIITPPHEPVATIEAADEVVSESKLLTVVHAPEPMVEEEVAPVAQVVDEVVAPVIEEKEETIAAPVIAEIAENSVIEAKAEAVVVPPAPVVAAPPQVPQGESAASEWMSAIESQLVVAQGQGWDETIDDEDDGFILALDDSVDDLDEDQRVLLYRDEDEHWADDVDLLDDELIQSLKEDGPAALLADLPPRLPQNPIAKEPASTPVPAKGKKNRRR